MSLSRGADKGETGIDWIGACGKDRAWRAAGGGRMRRLPLAHGHGLDVVGGGRPRPRSGDCLLARLARLLLWPLRRLLVLVLLAAVACLLTNPTWEREEEGPKVTRGWSPDYVSTRERVQVGEGCENTNLIFSEIVMIKKIIKKIEPAELEAIEDWDTCADLHVLSRPMGG